MSDPAQDFPKEERRRLAAKSRREFPTFGSVERQQVTEEVHHWMLEIEKGGTPGKTVSLPPPPIPLSFHTYTRSRQPSYLAKVHAQTASKFKIW